MADIDARVGADIRELKRDLKKATGEFRRFGRKAESDAKKTGQGISRGLKAGFAFAGIASATAAISGFFSIIKNSIKLYDVQAKAEAKLLTALKGRLDVQASLLKQATQLQGTTLFGDEETIEAQAFLATMGLQEDAIRRLIPLVQDLATKGNLKLTGAADLVAKSVGSSTNALSRYGIVIEGQVGSAERLESAVKALNEQVGGQAEAAALVGTGALTQFANVISDIGEDIGEALVPSLIEFSNWAKTADFQIIVDGFILIGKSAAVAADAISFAAGVFGGPAVRAYQAGREAMVEFVEAYKAGIEESKKFVGPLTQIDQLWAALGLSTENAGDTTTETTGAIAGAEAAVKLLNTQLRNASESEIPALIAQLQLAKTELDRLTEGELIQDIGGPIESQGARAGSVFRDSERAGLLVAPEFLTGIDTSPLERMIEHYKNLSTQIQRAIDVEDAFGLAFTESSKAAEEGLLGVAKSALSAARQVIQAHLAEAIAVQIRNALTSVPFPFNVAIAAAAGAAVSGLFNKLVPQLAIGTNFVQNDGIAQLHRGESVIPAQVAQGGFTGSGPVEVFGRLQAGDIYLSSREGERQQQFRR